MSSSHRLNRLMNDAWLTNDVTAARDAYDQYQACNCLYPHRQEIFDAHTQTMRYIDVPCGQCEHCTESKINEWCTRMYAHAEDFKRIYFVTLTYRSFYDDVKDVNKLMLNKLKDAVWHRDSHNSTKRYSYNPCLLCKKHYQDFLKRLRKYTGLNDITYVLSGELGHDWGRPHFHMILFTNGELTKSDIVRAWSIALWRNRSTQRFTYKTSQSRNGDAYYFPIGRVDFHDLVSNGTLNTTMKIRVDGTYMNAANCFAYVCKYVCKRDKANFSRLNIAYHALFHKEKYTKVFENDIPFNIVKDYLLKVGYSFDQADDLINNNKIITYEKTIFQPSPSTFSEGLSQNRTISCADLTFNEPIFNENYFEFRKKFSPFCEFSRGTPIGSVYASRNIQEFTQDVYTKPLLQEKGFVVPTYFRRKAREHLYGLRVCRPSLSGRSFSLSGIVYLLGRFSESAENGIPPREHYFTSEGHYDAATALRTPHKLFADFGTREKIILEDGFARHFTYNRHTRSYDNTRNIPVADFVRYWCKSIIDELARHKQLTDLANASKSARERAMLIALDLGEDSIALRDRFAAKREQQRKAEQAIYDELHRTAE